MLSTNESASLSALRPWEPTTPYDSERSIHFNPEGYVFLARKNPNWKQWSCETNELPNVINQLIGESDAYMSVNTFHKKWRNNLAIKNLCCLWADVDCVNVGYHPYQALFFIEELYRREIPEPNYEIASGCNLWLLWLLEPESGLVLPRWQACMSHINNRLKPFGADMSATDAARMMRIPGTRNTKTDGLVQIWERPKVPRYTLEEIVTDYLPDLALRKEKKPGRPRKIVQLFNLYTLHYWRLRDLVTLAELRDWDLRGYREKILFLFRYWQLIYVQDSEEALRQALDLNARFKHPLSEREVTTATRSAEKGFLRHKDGKGYNYSNTRLIEFLDITPEEQRHLKTIISATEKRRRAYVARKESRRDATGLTKRQRMTKERMEALRRAMAANPEATHAALAKVMGVSRPHVSKLMRKLTG